MGFTPHNSKHAVQTTVLAIVFGQDILDRAATQEDFPEKSRVLASLPGKRPHKAWHIAVGDGKLTQSCSETGAEFFLAEPDGTPAWLLRIASNHVAVECRVYTSWKHVWQISGEYLGEALGAAEKIAEKKVPLDSIEMKFIDRFESETPDYNLKDLFSESDYVPRFAFAAGAAWHAHTGWYEKSPRVLHNLNFDTKPVVENKEDGRWQVQITHFQRMSLDQEKQRVEFPAGFDHMHDSNTDLVRQILTNKMAKTVGLIKESA